jgi:hypothetical protein
VDARADPPGRTIGLHATDTDAHWLLDLTRDVITWQRADEQAAAEIRAPVTDLLLTIYRRRPVAGLGVTGDAKLVAFWLERVAFGPPPSDNVARIANARLLNRVLRIVARRRALRLIVPLPAQQVTTTGHTCGSAYSLPESDPDRQDRRVAGPLDEDAVRAAALDWIRRRTLEGTRPITREELATEFQIGGIRFPLIDRGRRENESLRVALRKQIPIAWFVGLEPGLFNASNWLSTSTVRWKRHYGDTFSQKQSGDCISRYSRARS